MHIFRLWRARQRSRRARVVVALVAVTLAAVALAAAPADPSTVATASSTSRAAPAAGWSIDVDALPLPREAMTRSDVRAGRLVGAPGRSAAPAAPAALVAPAAPAGQGRGLFAGRGMGLGVGAGVGRGAPLVAVVAFRATLGVPGSSRVWTVRGFGEACTALVHQGDACTLPDRVGRVSFGALRSPTRDGVVAGDRPELAGVVHLVTEPARRGGQGGETTEDVEGLAGDLGDVAAALRLRLARVAERATVAQVSSVHDLTATVAEVLDHPTEREVLPEAVGGQVTAMVGVHPSLRGGTALTLLPVLQHRFWVAAAAVERRQLTVTVRPRR